MGTFLGHLSPGLSLILLGVWWTLNIFKDFYKSKCKNGIPYQSHPWYPGPFFKSFPLESGFKVIIVIGSVIIEVCRMIFFNKFYKYLVNVQHLTMFTFFALNGVMDLLKYYNFALPDGIEVTSGILALSVEAFIFYNHLHDRQPMDIQVHMILFYLVIACIMIIFLEIQYENCVMASLSRAFFIILHGTWFCQIAFILYPPFGMRSWDLEDHEQMMIVSLIFILHIGIIFVLMLFIGFGVWACMKKYHQMDKVNYHMLLTDPCLTSPSLNE